MNRIKIIIILISIITMLIIASNIIAFIDQFAVKANERTKHLEQVLNY